MLAGIRNLQVLETAVDQKRDVKAFCLDTLHMNESLARTPLSLSFALSAQLKSII